MVRAYRGAVAGRWLAMSLLVLALGAMAEEPTAPPETATATATSTTTAVAPVTLDGNVLFKVRGAQAYPAEERAREIGKRIAAFAADDSLPVSSLRIEVKDDRTQILAGNQMLVTVVDADAVLEGLTRPQVADLEFQRIAYAVERYRHDRSPRQLWLAGLSTVVATAVLVLLMFGTRRLVTYLKAATQRRYQRRIAQLESETRKIVQAEHLQAMLLGAFGVANTLVQLALVMAYVEFVLGLWPWTRPIASRVLALVVDPLLTMGTAVLQAIPGLVFIAILWLVTRYALKIARLFFAAIAEGTISLTGFERDWALSTYRIVRFLTIAFAAVVAYPYIPGSDSLAFKGVSVFLGVLFSLGSTSLIANTVAGYTLVYRRAFKIGDRVRIGDHVGYVTAMRLQATTLRSLKNEEIVIPNSVVLGSSSVNYSTLAARNGLILHTTVGIGYETPWRQVEAMLKEAARRTPGLLPDPPPYVLHQTLGDFCVTYELNVYCDQPQQSEQLYTALHQNILDVFNEHNVQIMTPAYRADPAEPKVVAPDHWYLPPATKPEN
jgi:small-conductance mechanosensitive channel